MEAAKEKTAKAGMEKTDQQKGEKKADMKTADELNKREAEGEHPSIAKTGGALGDTTAREPDSTGAYDLTEDLEVIGGGGPPVHADHPTTAGRVQDSGVPF